MDSAQLTVQLKKFYDEKILGSKSKSQLYLLGIDITNKLMKEAKKLVADRRPEEVVYRHGLIKQCEDILRTMGEG